MRVLRYVQRHSRANFATAPLLYIVIGDTLTSQVVASIDTERATMTMLNSLYGGMSVGILFVPAFLSIAVHL